MDTRVQPANGFDFHDHSISALADQNHVNGGYKPNHTFTDAPPLSTAPPPGDMSPEEDGDFSDAFLNYISQMLMEEDLENKTCMFQDCSALQAAEKSFYDVLGEEHPPSPNRHPLIIADENAPSPDDEFSRACSSDYTFESILQPCGSSNAVDGSPMDSLVIPFQVPDSPNGAREKKNHYREDSDCVEEGGRSSKQLANNIYAEESEVIKMFDKVLLCPGLHDESALCPSNGARRNFQQKPKVGRPRKNQGNKREVVDLRSLLTQCAQAVSGGDSRTMNELLKRIRQHSSPYGDGGGRSAHYFADALEARLSGTGYADFKSRRISVAKFLKAYQVYVSACPFNKMLIFFVNRTIGKLAMNATRLHIIDFGILYGFQWPSLIQQSSARPGGPPHLRITGIDFPQPGFRPAERVEETGRRLANYCERFRVPYI